MRSVVITAPSELTARKTSTYSRVFGSWTATTSPGRTPAWWSPAVIAATRVSSPAFETLPRSSTRAAPSGFARAFRRSQPERVSERHQPCSTYPRTRSGSKEKAARRASASSLNRKWSWNGTNRSAR